MRLARWIAFTLLSSATACNCAHRGGPPPLEAKDATPDVTPNPVNFGNVPVGGKVMQQVVLTNIGELVLAVSSVQVVQPSGGGAATFGFGPQTNLGTPFGAAVQPGAKASVNLFCQPGVAGGRAGSLVIKSNSSAHGTYTVPLTCSGVSVDIVVQPPTVDFGNVQVGTTATKTVTLTNQGTSTSDPIALQPVSGTQAAEFAYTGTGKALGPNQALTLTVTFTPPAQGPASGLIQYQYCASCVPQVISLTGMGVDGQLVFSPDPVSFTGVPANQSVTAQVSLVNVGTAAVEIAAGDLKLTTGTVFSLGAIAPSLPATLQPDGAPLTFTVTYASTGGSNDTDQIDAKWVPLDASGAPVVGVAARTATDPVVGNGTLNPCTLQISPPSLNFGSATVGTPVQKSVTLTNTGQQDCTVSGIAISPSSDPAYSLVTASQTGFTVTANGGTQTIGVQCEVQTAGTPLLRKGALTFQTSDASQASVAVPLTTYLQAKGPYQNGWPKWHNDNTDQGQSLADTSGNQGAVLWQFRVGVPQSAGGILGSANPNPTYMNSPVVDEYGNVYQLGMDGTFYAIDPGGNQLWTTKLLPPNPDEHPATPIIAADDTIYIETGTDGASFSGAQLYHIDAATGKILFQAGPPTEQSCYSANGCSGADGFDVNPSIGNDGLLYDGDDFGQVVTYNLVSGGSFTQANGIILQFYGERVAVAIDQNNASYWCCLDVCFGVSAPSAGFQQIPAWPSTGAPIGQNSAAALGFTNSDLAYDQNHTGWLIVEAGSQTGSTGQTEVVAMDPTNGSTHWDVTLPSGTTPSSLSLLTGQGIFTSDVGNSAPAIATFPGQSNDGVAYVGNLDGLHALDVHTGKEVSGWPFKTPSDVDSAAAIGGDGTIFFGTADGTFYAVQPDGSQRFSYKAGGRISSSPAIGPDGTVFFVADDGQLYAIR